MGFAKDIYTILNAHTWSTIPKPTFTITDDTARGGIGDFYIHTSRQAGSDQLAGLDNKFYQEIRLFRLTFFEGDEDDLDKVESNIKTALGSDTTESTVWEIFTPEDDLGQLIAERVLRGRRTQWVNH